MRFFSNENREPDESSTVDVQHRAEQINPDQAHDEHPERVQSDPVTVPQQRSGSPWSDAPGAPGDNTDAELADQERADGTEEATRYDGDHRDDAGRPGDLADSDRVEESGAGADAALDRGRVEDPVDLPLDDTSTATSGEGRTGDAGAARADDTGAALRDEGGFDDPQAVDPATDRPLDADTADSSAQTGTSSTDADAALKDEGGFDDPQAVDPTTDRPLDTDTATATAAQTPANGAAVENTTAPVVPIPVPVGADVPATDTGAGTGTDAETSTETSTAAAAPAGDKLPGSVTEPDLSKIFAAEDAQSFQERWRDVQLRFVDSPKEATAEAASLLDEVVEKLASSLRAQRQSLSREASDDTEQLRVELRGYRAMFTRVLGL